MPIKETRAETAADAPADEKRRNLRDVRPRFLFIATSRGLCHRGSLLGSQAQPAAASDTSSLGMSLLNPPGSAPAEDGTDCAGWLAGQASRESAKPN